MREKKDLRDRERKGKEKEDLKKRARRNLFSSWDRSCINTATGKKEREKKSQVRGSVFGPKGGNSVSALK